MKTIQMTMQGQEAAQGFAQEHGFELLNEVIPDSNYFHMRYPKLRSKRSTEPAHHVTKKILDSNWEVFEAEQQIAKTRVKRDDIMQGNLYYYLNEQLYFGCCYIQHHAQTIHPTENIISMNLLQMSYVITWAWSF